MAAGEVLVFQWEGEWGGTQVAGVSECEYLWG